MRGAGVTLQKQDTQIERQDQDKINQFSRFNMKISELRDDVKKLKEEIENLQDAQELVEDSFGEGLKLFLGECFVTCEEDQATDYVEKLTEEKQDQLDTSITQQNFLRFFAGSIWVRCATALGFLWITEQLITKDPHQNKRHGQQHPAG